MATVYIWSAANTYCTTTTINGTTGWRLPTQAEISAFYTAYPNNSAVLRGLGWGMSATWSSTVSGGSHFASNLYNGTDVTDVDTRTYYTTCVR